MIYHKFERENKIITEELYEDEIFTFCGDCSREIQLTLEDIASIYKDHGDFSGTTFFCIKCSKKRIEELA